MSWRAGCRGIGACRALLPISAQTSAEDTVIILGGKNTNYKAISAVCECNITASKYVVTMAELQLVIMIQGEEKKDKTPV